MKADDLKSRIGEVLYKVEFLEFTPLQEVMGYIDDIEKKLRAIMKLITQENEQ